MPDIYQNKYRTQTTRLRTWDYGWNGLYFVTICTHNRECYFGDVVARQGEDHIDSDNAPGIDDVETQHLASLRDWDRNRQRRYRNHNPVTDDQNKKRLRLSKIGKIAQTCWQEIPAHFPFVQLGEYVIMPNHVHGIVIINKNEDGRDKHDDVSNPEPTKNKFGAQSKNLASIVRGYKTGVTKSARKIRPDFKWQPRYYDHIIRDEKSYQHISEYIINNPLKWADDKLYRV